MANEDIYTKAMVHILVAIIIIGPLGSLCIKFFSNNKTDRTSYLGKVRKLLFFVGALFSHFLVCGESPFVYNYFSVSPLTGLSSASGYCTAGILFSLLLYPFVRIIRKKSVTGNRGFETVTIALYLGAVIRALSWLLDVYVATRVAS